MGSKLVSVWRSLPITDIAWGNFSASVDLVLGKGYELQGEGKAQQTLRNNYSKFLADKFTFTHLFQALLILGLWHFAWLDVTASAVAFTLSLVAPILAKTASDFMQRINIEVFGALDPEADAPRQIPKRSVRSVLATIFVGIPLLAHNVAMTALFIPYAVSVKALGMTLGGIADLLSLCRCSNGDSIEEAKARRSELAASSSLSGLSADLHQRKGGAVTLDDQALPSPTKPERNRSGEKQKHRFSYTPAPAGSSPSGGDSVPLLDLGAPAPSVQAALPQF